jgi:hypothetical protein
MSARTMTQLVEGQPARLDVGESLPCRVIGFSGPEVVLALESQPEEEVAEGRVMRVTRDDVGVQFERIEDADRLLLASLALAYHRPR